MVVNINLPPPGRYVFVVQYYQPYSAGFDVDFSIPGELNGEGECYQGLGSEGGRRVWGMYALM